MHTYIFLKLNCLVGVLQGIEGDLIVVVDVVILVVGSVVV